VVHATGREGEVADYLNDAGRLRLPSVQAGRDAFVAGRDVIIQGMVERVARSAYLQQVRRIAPPDPPGLQDRDAELAQLAQFCLAEDGPSYLWWRAGPWAGKSALLSTFVLRPPGEVRERVRLVSFFITARLASQDTREAFIQVLVEQLADLLGQSLPAVLLEATREAFLLDLMSQAAAACAVEGRRLVLVVDGLDEDRGMTTGPDAHSIAGLLPADPPTGMRVIVASRPNPPVPDDVPDWHPLRDLTIVRSLAPSLHAREVERLARQELRRLLRGSQSEQDMLGLLAAARGGLSKRDLASLIGTPLWEVEGILDTAVGRTLHRSPSLLDPRGGREVYLMGHEELQVAARDYLGDRLSGYLDRLHAWAAGWQARQWPADTPEYLLTGYFLLLADLGDRPRMVEWAGDVARHDRMLELTGGDAAAITETTIALDRIAAEDNPDLANALALACHRDHLADRNSNIPALLPAVWVILGQVPRAEALAHSITDQPTQVSALAQAAVALAQAGERDQARALAKRARVIARSITDRPTLANALSEVTEALAGAGEQPAARTAARRAEAAAFSISDPCAQASALARIAVALALAREFRQAKVITKLARERASPITDPYTKAGALARVGAAIAAAGEYQEARSVTRQAQAAALSLSREVPRTFRTGIQ